MDTNFELYLIIGVNDTQVKECTNIYYALNGDNLNLTPYWKFVNCARKTLGMGEWEGKE